MYRFRPESLLVIFSAAATAFTMAAAFVRGWPGLWCVVCASFFMSILFPTVFGLAIRNVRTSMKSASALLIMASGAANVALPTMNLLVGVRATPYVVLLPGICFGLITAYALVQRKDHGEEPPRTIATSMRRVPSERRRS